MRHRVEDALLVARRVALAHGGGFVEREAGRHVAEPQIVRRRLIGRRCRDAGRGDTIAGSTSATLPTSAIPVARRSALSLLGPIERLVERPGDLVDVAGPDAMIDAGRVHLDGQAHAAVHRHGERLRATHPTEPGGHDEPAFEAAAEVLAGAFREGLVGALENALRPDVNPRARGHLPVHRQAERLEPPELVPARPARHEVRVGDEDARRFVVRAEDADRLPALHDAASRRSRACAASATMRW